LFLFTKKVKKYTFMMKIFALVIQLLLSKTPAEPVVSNPSVIEANNAINAEKTDISGHWEGTITRDEGGGKRTVFKMELDLVQKGKSISGTSYVHADGEKRTYSANMALSGRFTQYYLKYEETKILNYDAIPDAEWCVKKCELLYKVTKGKDAKPTLEGIWEGKAGSTGDCIPGRIFLQKAPARV
jgi:hypothetical protein